MQGVAVMLKRRAVSLLVLLVCWVGPAAADDDIDTEAEDAESTR